MVRVTSAGRIVQINFRWRDWGGRAEVSVTLRGQGVGKVVGEGGHAESGTRNVVRPEILDQS